LTSLRGNALASQQRKGADPIDTGILQLASVISAHGGEFLGLRESPRGLLVMFTDLQTRSTLALPQAEISFESLSRRLRESRESHARALLAQEASA
jgi:hypothetical protein